ncbi:hypothetical protein TBR22_A31520 [Luteitalea sp. TBR-22]|uniref:hypothetical protein n=1 Tax=Luteitalea sp. TBR-22 TaxID=2802971 RepID=UPI001AF2C17C|nr:hypothetical protein [Luteitalea sp. TBR-22]BCS33924.1 hypothetical protein TBR22_A31520 [Luteitalea sp. TBR-22]
MKTLSLVLLITALGTPVLAQDAPHLAPPAMMYVNVPDTPQAAQPAPPRAPQPAQPPQGGEKFDMPVPPPAPPPSAERRPLPTRNVKVDVTITEQSGTSAPVKKVVAMVVADGRSGGVRAITTVPVYTGNTRDLPLNVDATVTVTPEQRVLLELRFNYSSMAIMAPELPKGFAATNEAERLQSAPRPSQVNIVETVTALLTPGTPTVVARSADAATDRTVTVEVKAEILK